MVHATSNRNIISYNSFLDIYIEQDDSIKRLQTFIIYHLIIVILLEGTNLFT